MATGADLSQRYAFVGRELLGLLHTDPLLAAEHAAVRVRRTATFGALARRWRANGVLRPLDDQGIADLVQALWVIAEMWLAVGALDGTYVDSADGERLLRIVLEPYLLAEWTTGARSLAGNADISEGHNPHPRGGHPAKVLSRAPGRGLQGRRRDPDRGSRQRGWVHGWRLSLPAQVLSSAVP